MAEPRETLDLHRLLDRVGAQHLIGSLGSADLNVNLLAFAGNDGVEEHTNTEVDVLLVAMDGEGVVTIEGEEILMTAGQVTIIPKGAARSIRADGGRFAYLTCHGQRRGLMPKPRAR